MNGFLEEVKTQGILLEQSYNKYTSVDYKIVKEIVDFFHNNKLNKIIFAGMGSSLYAIDTVISFLTQNGINAYYFNSFDLARFNSNKIDDKTLVVVISQSGKSWEGAEVVEIAKKTTKVVGVYNVEGSNLSRICDFYLTINCGIETSLSNKSYELTILVLNLLAQALVEGITHDFREQIEFTISWIKEWIGNYEKRVLKLVDFINDYKSIDFIANDSSLSVAKQMALIYREGLHVFTAAWELADYAHGQYLGAGPGYVAVVLVPNLSEDPVAARIIATIIKRRGKVVLLTNQDIEETEDVKVVLMPKVRGSILAMAEAIPTQLLLGVLLGSNWIKGQ